MTEDVVSTVTYLKQHAGFPVGVSLYIIGLPRVISFRWSKTSGKEERKENKTPKDHWLLDWESERIIAYKREHPEIGYRRLAWMMIDAGIVAVSSSSVYCVLLRAAFRTAGRHRRVAVHIGKGLCNRHVRTSSGIATSVI